MTSTYDVLNDLISGSPEKLKYIANKIDNVDQNTSAILKGVLVIGQSNAYGSSTTQDELRDYVDPRILAFPAGGVNKSKLVIAKEHLPNLDGVTTDPGISLSTHFCKNYIRDNPTDTIVILPNARGNTGFSIFEGNANINWRVDGDLRALAIAQVNDFLALGNTELTAILWHQGEFDVSLAMPIETYIAQLDGLINDLRSRFGASIPFIVGQMSRNWLSENIDKNEYDFYANKKINQRFDNVAFVSSEGITNESDVIHFDSPGLRELGRRYYDAFLQAKGFKRIPAPVNASVTALTSKSCLITPTIGEGIFESFQIDSKHQQTFAPYIVNNILNNQKLILKNKVGIFESTLEILAKTNSVVTTVVTPLAHATFNVSGIVNNGSLAFGSTGSVTYVTDSDRNAFVLEINSDEGLVIFQALPTNFTFSCWYKQIKPTTRGTILSLPDDNDFALIQENVAGFGCVRNNAYLANESEVILKNKWIHITLTFDNATNTFKFYKNGILFSTLNGARPIGSRYFVGLRNFGFGGINGKLDDVRIYAQTLSQLQIGELL
jgi:hypothetical protein